jgi:hypothetical protein
MVDGKRYQYILVVQDIFARFIWTRAVMAPTAVEAHDAFKDMARAQGAQYGEGVGV